jgi:hypothetical protein
LDDTERDSVLADMRKRFVHVFTGFDSETLMCSFKDGVYIHHFDNGCGGGSVHLHDAGALRFVIGKWFWDEYDLGEVPSEVAQYVWEVDMDNTYVAILKRHKAQEDSETATKKRERSSGEEEEEEADTGLAAKPAAKKARRPTIYDADWFSEENQAERAKREEKKIAKYLAIARNHVAAHKDHLTLTFDSIGIPISRGRKLELVFCRHTIACAKDVRLGGWAINNFGGYFKDLPTELEKMRFEVLSVDRENQTAELKLQEEASLYI